MRFTYIGGADQVDLVISVRRGETIDVPDRVAGRPYSEVRDPESGDIVSRDHGAGLLAQPDAWEHDAGDDPADLRADPEQALDLDGLSVAQLRTVADERGVDTTGLTRKAALRAAIENHDKEA